MVLLHNSYRWWRGQYVENKLFYRINVLILVCLVSCYNNLWLQLPNAVWQSEIVWNKTGNMSSFLWPLHCAALNVINLCGMTANKDINIKAMKNGWLQQLIKNKQVAGVIGLFFFIIILIWETGPVSHEQACFDRTMKNHRRIFGC